MEGGLADRGKDELELLHGLRSAPSHCVARTPATPPRIATAALPRECSIRPRVPKATPPERTSAATSALTFPAKVFIAVVVLSTGFSAPLALTCDVQQHASQTRPKAAKAQSSRGGWLETAAASHQHGDVAAVCREGAREVARRLGHRRAAAAVLWGEQHLAHGLELPGQRTGPCERRRRAACSARTHSTACSRIEAVAGDGRGKDTAP